MEELEQYLSGKLSAEERRRLEEKIATDPVLQAELRVREGLRQLRLQGKLDEAANARKDWERRRKRHWLGGIVVAMLLVGMAVFVFWKNVETPLAPALPVQRQPQPETTKQPENKEVAPILPEAENEKKVPPPIAERKAKMDEQPLLRSAYEDLDPFTFQLLDTLLALTRKSPKADSNWQKAMNQFAEGKPMEARATIFQLEKTDAEEAMWLLALAQLTQGKMEEATAVFESITRTAGHPRQVAAKMALEKLRE